MSSPLTEREQALLGPRLTKRFGSAEWCWQTVTYLKSLLRYVQEDWQRVDPVLDELRKARAWEKIPPDAPYGSLDKMLRAEVGLTAQKIDEQVRTAREKYEAQSAAKPVGHPLLSNVGTANIREKGNTTEHVVARLKRDAEHGKTESVRAEAADLLEQIYEEKISPNAAAIQTGIRKRKIEIRVHDPRLVADQLRKHMTPEQIAQLIQLLLTEEE